MSNPLCQLEPRAARQTEVGVLVQERGGLKSGRRASTDFGAGPLKPRGSEPWRDCLLLLVIGVAVVVVLGRGIFTGGLRYGDEAAHAMDGVLIRDWIAAGPQAWRQPMDFAQRQYAHYPTLGIGTHYPPGFAIVEAAFFALFGISAFTTRLTVLCFSFAATSGIYVLLRMHGDRVLAALGAIAWLVMPATVEWGRQTMLEVPTVSILIWCTVAFAWYLRRPTWRRLLLLFLGMTVSLLFKQTAVFVFVAAAIALVVQAIQRRIPPNHAYGAVFVAVVMLLGVTYSLGGHGSQLLRGDATYGDRWSWVVLTGYLQILPSQLGWPVLLCALLGLLARRKKMHGLGLFLFACFVICDLMLTVADFKYNRYLYVGLFPFAIWAALGIRSLLDRLPTATLRATACLAVTLVGCGWAWAQHPPTRPDPGIVVQTHRNDIEGRAVLFSGLREGDFAFSVRQHLPWRCAVVMRGSKLFYTCNGRPDLDFASRVDSPTAVGQLLEQTAIEFLFVERENKTGVAEENWLRQFLAESPAYRRIASHTLPVARDPSPRDTIIDVYQAVGRPAQPAGTLELHIPRTGQTLRFDITTLLPRDFKPTEANVSTLER